MVKRAFVACLALAAILGSSAVAGASPITVSFTGTIDALSPLFASFNVTGTYVYDTTSTSRVGDTSTGAVYDQTSGFAFSVLDGSNVVVYTGSSTSSEIQIGNVGGVDADRYAVVANSFSHGLTGAPNPPGSTLSLFFLSLLDSTQLTITDALTVNLNPTTHVFTSRTFGFDFTNDLNGGITSVGGDLTSLRVVVQDDAAVPEPTTLLLLGTGLAVAARKKFNARA